jgi:hypothetical protein
MMEFLTQAIKQALEAVDISPRRKTQLTQVEWIDFQFVRGQLTGNLIMAAHVGLSGGDVRKTSSLVVRE